MSHVFTLLSAAMLGALSLMSVSGKASRWKWARGSLHTHTNNSDGDTDPQEVAAWYRDHGYQFLVISDHGKVTDISAIDLGSSRGFVLVPGEEIGVSEAKPAIHGNSIGIPASVGIVKKSSTPGKTLAKMVNRVRRAGGIPMVNHPNFQWSFGHREIREVKGTFLLEVFNGHPKVWSFGCEAFLPVEQTWDILLSEGRTIYATAVDDAHHYQRWEDSAANPGRGWVYVRVPKLTPDAILAAISKGDFYASTGVELEDCGFDDGEYRVSVKPAEDETYLIRFVGKWGRILQETEGVSAAYKATGKAEPNDYVRCKVISSGRKAAWAQAVRIK